MVEETGIGKGFPFSAEKLSVTMTLGCGTWGGNSTSSNVTWEHLLNYTWVSYPIPSTQPSDLELLGSVMYED